MTYSDLIYATNIEVTAIVMQYFHSDYAQCINGVSMNREEYIQYVLQQKHDN